MVFVFLKYRDFSNEKFNQIIKKLSEYSFGACLVHVFVLDRIGITTLTFNPVISIVIMTVEVFVISFLLSGILHKIPVVKKYIVLQLEIRKLVAYFIIPRWKVLSL